ncbi:MAG: hypothetical protein U9R49_03010, partial [Bacteroidota bacterium]|nr:hypothetical protein [Bacteroidota bacterium]
MKTNFQFLFIGLFTVFTACAQQDPYQYQDAPYLQDYADKFELSTEENQADLIQVRSDRNLSINILSTDGLLQAWEKNLVRDQRYRPLTDEHIIAFDTYRDQFVYLTDKAVLSNAWAGKFYSEHHVEHPTHFVMGEDFSFLVAAKEKLVLFQNNKKVWEESIKGFVPLELLFDTGKQSFIVLSDNALYTLDGADQKLHNRFSGNKLTAISLINDQKQIVVGTEDGILSLDSDSFEETSPINKKLPDTNISCITEINGKLWFGSGKGAFAMRQDGNYDYYASKRWLVDDQVLDICPGPENSVLILTETGLSKINFVEMTLAEKAEYFQKVQRLRHIRHGFSSEGNLSVPGDPSSIVLGDTDNDGLWTSMYLAGELFRYAATKSEDALHNAYEAFEAMERLTEISGIPGFPARTYEIDGYQSSDNDPDMPEDQK